MSKRQWIIIGSALLILLISFGSSYYFSTQKEEPFVKKSKPNNKFVKTTPVKYQDIQTHVVAFGRVNTAQSLDLLSEVSGRMFQGNIRLKEGERFNKGDLIFYVDDKEASLTLKSQKSNFLRDIAGILPDLKIDYSKHYDTWNGFFSKLDINKPLPELPPVESDQLKTFLATKGIYSTYYTIQSAQERLRKYRYYAPFDGSVIEVNMESGAFINPGTKIGKIIKTGTHELKVAVETRDIPWIQMGTEVAVYSDETQQSWTGQVARISEFVNQNTQSVDVFISLNPTNQKIYDGQFMQAAIPARVIKDGMTIPRKAIYNGSEVFVVEDTLLKVKQIDIYRTTEEHAIVSGLPVGTDIVVEPLVNAHNNMVVRKLEQKDIDLETGVSAQNNAVNN